MMPDEEDQRRLEYRNYIDDHPQRRSMAGTIIGGAFLGALSVSVIGFFGFLSIIEIHVQVSTTRPSATTRHISPLVPAFGLGMLIAGGLTIYVLRRQNRSYFLGGYLCGIALACLIEGLCFASV